MHSNEPLDVWSSEMWTSEGGTANKTNKLLFLQSREYQLHQFNIQHERLGPNPLDKTKHLGLSYLL